MEIRGVRHIQEILGDLKDRADELIETFTKHKEILDYADDVHVLDMFCFWLEGITPAMLGTEHHFYGVMYDAEDSMNDNHDGYEKLLFLMQKHFKLYIKEELLPTIEVFIEFVRGVEMDDYRARDYQMDLARKMEMIRDYYKTRYGLD